MKRISLILAAATVLSAGAAFAVDTPQSGGFNRIDNNAGAQGTGCRSTSTTFARRVNWDSNLNSLGANVNVRPFAGCTLRERVHQTQLQTWCFGGDPAHPFSTIQNGTAATDADILHLCGTGGQSSFFVARDL
jgi:hypothetical protein